MPISAKRRLIMDWIQVTIYTSSEGIEPLSGILYGLGITGIEIEDESDFKDFLENNKQYWDYVDEALIKEKEKETCVKIYVSDNAAGYEMLAAVKSALQEFKERDENGEFGRLEIDLGSISEEDWANNWKKYFHPINVGDKILIKPEWEDAENPDGRVVFNVNPGMSFGTGSHETTRLCIEALEKLVTPETDMLDLGCGSGILSIISLLLGARSAYAVDIDPNAVDIAYKNAGLNDVDKSKFVAKAGNILCDEALKNEISQRKYPLVVANIVADVIIGLLPFAVSVLESGGTFVTSGIIADRQADVEKALQNASFENYTVSRSGEWVSIICKK